MKSLLKPNVSLEDFSKKSTRANRVIFLIGASFGAFMGFFNMMHVLFVPNPKFVPVNNYIYFTFYAVYFLCCLSFIIVDQFVKLPSHRKYHFYQVSGIFVLVWHLLYNIYHVNTGSFIGYFTAISVVFFFTGLLMFRPVYTLLCLILSYLAFVVTLKHAFGSGEIINFSLTVSLCIIMYLIRYKHFKIEIIQAKQIRAVQQEINDMHQDFRLTMEQYELIRERECSASFEWNIADDRIRFSKEWTQYFDQPREIENFHKYVNDLTYISDDQRQSFFQCMNRICEGAVYQKFEMFLPTKDSDPRWFQFRVITQVDEEGQPVSGIGIISDISDQQEKVTHQQEIINQLETKVKLDLFTGLLNKVSIERYGKKKLEKLGNGEMLAALILDMDDFKEINDQYGHPTGDRVLKEVAQLLIKYAPSGVRIGRIGGDEFMALWLTEDLKSFKNYAKILVENISKITVDGKLLAPQCSIGMTAATSPLETYDMLYQRTDIALYEAKKNGKNQIYFTSVSSQQIIK